MKRQSKIPRSRVWVICLLAILTLLLGLSVGNRGFMQQLRVKLEQRRLNQRLEVLEEETAGKRKEQEALAEPDSQLVEKMAREKYGMAKKNERVYRVVPPEEQ